MLRETFPSLSRGIDKVKKNPQLFYTLFLALVITLSFFIVVDKFANIARDSQDRLTRNRVGQMQDSFSQFALDYMDTTSGTERLQDKMERIAAINNTYVDFRVVKFSGGKNIIIASINKNEVGSQDTENNFSYELTKSHPNSPSHTEYIEDDGSRYFITIRGIQSEYGDTAGAVLIKSYLSEADAVIEKNINQAYLFFIFIIILIMILFFRHSRIIDYSSLYRRIKEVDKLKDDFVSMASHELRSPLTVIRGYTENLLDGADNLTDDQKKSAERIDISAKQLDDLVNDMLDVSRIDQGRMKISPVIINPNTAISDVVSGFVKVAEDKNLKLNFKHSVQENVKVKLDPDKFRQVMTNLIGNSIKYTQKGEVKVSATVEKNIFVIKVVDTGIGMSSDEQKSLFQKFYRVRNTETKEVRGTGLGLWITKQMVELMGGKINVESIKGVGTHFIVSFPAV